MKKEHKQAQALLDAMEQVDAGILQQAYTTDTPEKFRTLGKLTAGKAKTDRPVTQLRQWVALAACLAITIVLAAAPWFFSTLLPAIMQPTDPTIPPTTTDPRDPTDAPIPLDSPYDLLVSYDAQTINAAKICYNWTYAFDGKSYNVYADGWHPLLPPEGQMPWLTVDATTLLLDFAVPPDSVEVICWDAKHIGNVNASEQNEKAFVFDGKLLLKSGNYVYEVTAQWGDHHENYGRVTYVFSVNNAANVVNYEYTSENGDFLWPSMLLNTVERDALKTTTENGTFLCFTQSTAQADDFIAAQQVLLDFLRENGMEIEELIYYATDYDDSYSQSTSKEAYIALSAVRSWRQVLVTLQSMWGDYTSYGYVYAMANAISRELGWQADPESETNAEALMAFFQQNPAAVILEYPCFTTVYAPEETAENCKALSGFLFAENFGFDVLHNPVEDQLARWYASIENYAQQTGIPFTRQNIGYAYCSQRIPLRIKIACAEIYVDENYVDGTYLFADAFADYSSIYETAGILCAEITEAAEYCLHGEDVTTPIYFMSEKTASARFRDKFTVSYKAPQYGDITFTRYLSLYMYGFCKHISYQWNPDPGQSWQSQAFSELGRSKSWFAQYTSEVSYTQHDEGVALFYACTGRSYEPGRDDFFEVMDILCFINDYYTLMYNPIGPASSMAGYLLERYGEEDTALVLLSPDRCKEITGKTWKELEAEWGQYIRDKYADVVLPEDFTP